jgi:hypothetical protein
MHGLARPGVSELHSFMFNMPLLTLDRWLHKRASRRVRREKSGGLNFSSMWMLTSAVTEEKLAKRTAD